MQNNDTINMILQNGNSNQSQSIPGNDSQKLILQKEIDIPVSKIRVISAKYKLYVVLLLIGILYLGFEAIPNIRASRNTANSILDNKKNELNNIKKEITEAQNDVELINEITGSEDSLRLCLNQSNSDSCNSLPENWNQDFSIPLSYSLLQSLYSKKMPVNEKKVLKNLNEYLIKEDIAGNTKAKVGEIQHILIGDPEVVEDEKINNIINNSTSEGNHLFQVPITVTISFESIGDLTGFLYNVEKKMIENREDRILYKIQSVSYDILSSDEPQVTDIEMIAYYYYDERFNDSDNELVNNDPEDSKDSDNNTSSSDTDNSNSIKKEPNESEDDGIVGFIKGIFS